MARLEVGQHVRVTEAGAGGRTTEGSRGIILEVDKSEVPYRVGLGDDERWFCEDGVEAAVFGLGEILEARGSRYGKFEDNAVIAQDIKDVMRKADNWPCIRADVAQALDMIASKISRILVGDPNYADNWVDIAGYATLVKERIEGGR